ACPPEAAGRGGRCRPAARCRERPPSSTGSCTWAASRTGSSAPTGRAEGCSSGSGTASTCRSRAAAAGSCSTGTRGSTRSSPRSMGSALRTLLLLAAAVLLLALPAPAGTRLRPVPILMYHVVTTAPANASYPELYVSRGDFAGQVGWLAAHGYRAVTLQRVFDSWRGAARLPPKPVVLSFD